MVVKASYRVKLLDQSAVIGQTVMIYQEAVAYVIDVVNKEWSDIEPVYKKNKSEAQGCVEDLIHSTKRMKQSMISM